MKLKNCLILSLLSIVLCLGLAPLGMYGHHWKLLAASLLYFAVTLFFLNKTESTRHRWLVAVIMVLPPLAIYFPIHLRNFEETLISLPSTSAHFVGIAFALLTHEVKGKARFVFPIFLLVLAPLTAFTAYPLWLNKLNFGTFTGSVHYPLPAPIKGVLQNEQPLQNEDWQGKVVLLDFWHTRCGVCFRKFPLLQKLYDRYKDHPSVRILAVNKPLETDSAGQAFAMVKQREYSFPVLIPTDKLLPEAFEVKAYPTTVVINKAGSVIYKGSIENAEAVIDELLVKGM